MMIVLRDYRSVGIMQDDPLVDYGSDMFWSERQVNAPQDIVSSCPIIW